MVMAVVISLAWRLLCFSDACVVFEFMPWFSDGCVGFQVRMSCFPESCAVFQSWVCWVSVMIVLGFRYMCIMFSGQLCCVLVVAALCVSDGCAVFQWWLCCVSVMAVLCFSDDCVISVMTALFQWWLRCVSVMTALCFSDGSIAFQWRQRCVSVMAALCFSDDCVVLQWWQHCISVLAVLCFSDGCGQTTGNSCVQGGRVRASLQCSSDCWWWRVLRGSHHQGFVSGCFYRWVSGENGGRVGAVGHMMMCWFDDSGTVRLCFMSCTSVVMTGVSPVVWYISGKSHRLT